MRQDGLCAHPDCQHPLTKLALAHADPWCSAVCARAHHSVVFKPDLGASGKGEKRKAAA